MQEIDVRTLLLYLSESICRRYDGTWSVFDMSLNAKIKKACGGNVKKFDVLCGQEIKIMTPKEATVSLFPLDPRNDDGVVIYAEIEVAQDKRHAVFHLTESAKENHSELIAIHEWLADQLA